MKTYLQACLGRVGCYALLLASFLSLTARAQSVDVWITKGDQSALLQQQGSLSFGNNSGGNTLDITVDAQTTYQTLDGFGFALTQGSAQALLSLSSGARSSLLQELFNPSSGNAISVVRISIGASDLSNSTYSYNESWGDVNMNNFSLAGPDQTYLLPVLQEILAINPNIKVLATPWTAPTWMKTNGGWIGGSLQSNYYQAYANYFMAYLNAMASQGISIWAITPQNEPENPWNEPSMTMNATEQRNFINGYLGPAIANSSYNTKIIAFDHNCDNTSYPTEVLNNSNYVDGAAFHLYAGNISAMSTVRNNTGKNVYFTEQFTSSNGNFNGDLGWHMQNVVVGSIRNWSKTVIEWNLATDTNYGPRTPGGCTECLGAITVTGSNSYNRNVSYYIISQVSKFVQPGAQRIGSNTVNGVENVAFRNPDGSQVLLAYNGGNNTRTIKVFSNGQSFVYGVPARTAATFVWNGSAGPTPPAAPSGLNASPQGTSQIQLNWSDNASNESEYVIERSPTGTGSWAWLATLGTNNTQYTDGGLQPATPYYYRVRSGNSAGASTWSNVAQATTDALPPSSGIISGQTYRITNRASGRAMDVESVSLDNGARIQQWDWSGSGGNNQKWVVTQEANGNYRLTAVHSGKALDVVDVSYASGGELQQWDYFGSANQQFAINNLGNGYFQIIASHSNLALGLDNGSTGNGVRIKQLTNNYSNRQQWAFDLVSSLGGREAEPIALQPQVSVYPNPIASGQMLQLHWQSRAEEVSYSLTNLQGQLVQKEVVFGRQSAEVQLPMLESGVYLVTLTGADFRQIRRLVIK